MSRNLSITKGLSTEIRVVMADSREISGCLFLAEHSPNHSGEETVLDVLNHPQRQFIPLSRGSDTMPVMVNKDQIIALQPRTPNTDKWPQRQGAPGDCWEKARIEFTNWTLEGRAYTGDLKPERRRLMDLLNHPEQFFIFETEESPWIINKEHVIHLEPAPDQA